MLLASGVALARTFDGTAGPNTIVGTAGADDIRGRGGNDTLSGAGGNDRVRGDSGNDTVSGNSGADEVRGDIGNDLDGQYLQIAWRPFDNTVVRLSGTQTWNWRTYATNLTVFATNAVGDGPASPASAVARPDEKPDPPAAPTLEFGDRPFKSLLRRVSETTVEIARFLVVLNGDAFVGVLEGEERRGIDRHRDGSVVLLPVLAGVNRCRMKVVVCHVSTRARAQC